VTVTTGVLSRVVEVKGRAVCIHSSAEIQGGNSGGLLVNKYAAFNEPRNGAYASKGWIFYWDDSGKRAAEG
jgi:hypothetical protein